jgi:hypothetical protein
MTVRCCCVRVRGRRRRRLARSRPRLSLRWASPSAPPSPALRLADWKKLGPARLADRIAGLPAGCGVRRGTVSDGCRHRCRPGRLGELRGLSLSRWRGTAVPDVEWAAPRSNYPPAYAHTNPHSVLASQTPYSPLALASESRRTRQRLEWPIDLELP